MAGVTFLVCGAVLVSVALALAAGRRDFVRTASVANGVVVRRNAGGSHPQIEFLTGSGQKVSYPQGGLIFGYKPGDNVRVRYDPAVPGTSACIDAFGALWAFPLFLGGIGLLFLVFGLASVLARQTPTPS
jgi:hypothetical protein